MKRTWLVGSGIVVAIIIISLVVQNQNLQGQLTALQQKDSDIALQDNCATAAAAFFKPMADYSSSMGGSEMGSPTNPITSYTNHWNSGQNKCFILEVAISASSGRIVKSYSLYDAVQGKAYGELDMANNQIVVCSLYPTGDTNNPTQCASRDEFNTYTDRYMNG